MKLAGLHYLHTVLRPVVERIYQERRPCEVGTAYTLRSDRPTSAQASTGLGVDVVIPDSSEAAHIA